MTIIYETIMYHIVTPILDNLLQRIGYTNKVCVEFGAYDGVKDITPKLIKVDGFRGIFIEANENRYELIRQNTAELPVTVLKSFITTENINQLFNIAGVPKSFDFLSIDIDGMDYWIWKSLENYRPRILFIEYNAVHLPPKLAVQPYNPNNVWNKTRWFGASLQSLVNLGKTKGYELVGCCDRGSIAIFVTKEEYYKLDLADNSAESLWLKPTYGVEADGGHPYPDGPYLEI